MSNTSQGPGWWRASDGKWYDPSLAPPGYVSPQPKEPEDSSAPFYKKWWLWAIVVVVLLLATVGGVALQSKSTKASNAGPTVTSTTTRGTSPTTRGTSTTTRGTSTTNPRVTTTTKPSSPNATTASPATALPLTGGPPPSSTTEATPSDTVASNCAPRSRAGKCFWPGEYCPKSDYGTSGIGGDGKPMMCLGSAGWKWVLS